MRPLSPSLNKQQDYIKGIDDTFLKYKEYKLMASNMKLIIGILLVASQLEGYVDADSASAGAAAAAASDDDSAAATAAATAAVFVDDSDILHPHSVSCQCPLIYKPVCGTDGRTYSNECVLRCISDENVRNGRWPIFVLRQGECPQVSCICPAVYQPVCGSDGHTYENECRLGCENRRRQKLGLPLIILVSRSACPAPPCICSGVVIPVCGTDNRTYRNICFLQCASRLSQAQGRPPIYIQSSGACRTESCPCLPQYKPVCASDDKTYNNTCFLNCENRRRNALGLYPLYIKYLGSCYNCNCPPVNDPVCASDDRTYRNPCVFRCVNAARIRDGLPPLTIKHKGVCGCNCQKYYDPVCGTDGNTYNNICLLHCESNRRQSLGLSPIFLAYGGRCICNCRNCHTGWQPVCGSDGKTYWNSCWLKCFSACNEKNGLPKIKIVKPGFC